MPLVLKDIVGLPLKEVAAILGLKVGTVKTRLHRARLKLRQSLEAVLPRRLGEPAAYSKQVCLDLLRAKQESLDHGVDFPLDDVLCERCQSVFGSMDLVSTHCRDLARGELPAALRRAIETEIS